MNEQRLKRRLLSDRLFKFLICLFSGFMAIPLLAILGEVLLRGYDQLSWTFFTEPTPTAYKAMKAAAAGLPVPGGIANGIVGTVIMLGMAALVAIPVGILGGVYLAENGKKRFAVAVSYLTDLLQGTPSVIIGIITYTWVVVPMKGYSAIAGSVALFIMMLPLIVRSTEETIRILPASLREAGLALGGNRARVTLKVLLPSAFGSFGFHPPRIRYVLCPDSVPVSTAFIHGSSPAANSTDKTLSDGMVMTASSPSTYLSR